MQVVNVRKDKYEVYGGRPSVFGNPFTIGKDGDRETVIAKYKRYFWKRINTDREFYEAVIELKDKVVGCYCKPQACHLDVIKAWFDAGCPTLE
jgi:hypothetical protein